LDKLEKQVQSRVIAVIERIRVRPEAHLQKLVGEPAYKLRVGDYHVIAEIDERLKRICVLKTGHRRNIYYRF